MYNNRMTSFRSQHYPRSKQAFVIGQEYAIRYYAIFMLFVMIAVMIRLYAHREVVYFGVIGAVIAILLGNIFSGVKMRRSIAEVFFVNDGFSIISVYDILHQTPKRSFPLKFANPTRTADQIQFHFEDQIMFIKREDWPEEFELIWSWFNSGTPQYGAAPNFGTGPGPESDDTTYTEL